MTVKKSKSIANSCFRCIHLIKKIEIEGLYPVKKYRCEAHPKNGHLKQFPFKTTQCKKYEDLKGEIDESQNEMPLQSTI